MATKLKLGLLEFGKRQRRESITSIHEIFDYAKKADQIGYSRFWLTEHHTFSPEACWNSPEPMIPLLAGITNTIKIGIAGVLINLHSAYRVSLNFKLLANLFENRIELGIAKGIPENDEISKFLLQGIQYGKQYTFKEKLRILNQCLNEEVEMYNQKMILPPLGGFTPPLWYLSRSFNNMEEALNHKMNYSKSLIHPKSDLRPEIDKITIYRDNFFKKYSTLPEVNIAVSVCCASSTEKAKSYIEKRFGHGNN